MDPRTRTLLEAPILPTLLRLAVPNVVTTTVQASTGLIETYFIGKLGTDALAGVALVFPASADADDVVRRHGWWHFLRHCPGARRRPQGRCRWHGAACADHRIRLCGILSGLMLAGGSWLYAALGGRGASLRAAQLLRHRVRRHILVWLFNTLANVIRGTGAPSFRLW